MSLHLYATRLVIVLEVGKVKDHDGNPYKCEDLKPGDVLAYDKDNNIYIWKGGYEARADKREWPKKDKSTGLIQLWRDYWEVIVGPAHKGPYHESVRNSKVRSIIG